MLTLYHAKDTRSMRCLWLLEELGLKYDLRWVAYPPAARQPEFLTINPAGTLPLLVDGDRRLSESCAVLLYLSHCHGSGRLSLPAQDPAYADLLQWTFFGETELACPLASVFRYSFLLPKPQRLPSVADDYREKALRNVAVLECALESRPYLCGQDFTVADIAVGYALLLGELLGLSDKYPPASKAYLGRLKEREALARARAMEPA